MDVILEVLLATMTYTLNEHRGVGAVERSWKIRCVAVLLQISTLALFVLEVVATHAVKIGSFKEITQSNTKFLHNMSEATGKGHLEFSKTCNYLPRQGFLAPNPV